MIIITIIIAVLCVGLGLAFLSLKNKYDALEEDYFDIADRHEQVCKELDIIRRENKVLAEENAKLNKFPKNEKISKPRKTTTRKTTKK